MSAALCMSSPDGKHVFEKDGRCHYCPERAMIACEGFCYASTCPKWAPCHRQWESKS